MRSFFYWGALLATTLVLSSCKTQMYPTVSKDQYYQIDGSIPADSSIINYYTPYKKQLEEEMDRVLGYSDQHLSRTRGAESLAGNFFADALLWKGQQLDPDVTMSFATKGGIRADLKAGNITVGGIFEMMPFENAITILTLTGKDVLRWAAFIAETGGQPTSGITLRIKDGQIDEFLIQGRPVDPDATYKLVTYDYLANGGDYVTVFDNVLARKDYPQRVREALIEYVSDLTKQGKHIQAQLDGRVEIFK